MKDLFNKNFFRFTLGFIGIILLSYAFAIAVVKFDKQKEIPANAVESRE
jgi:hypothetical protein